MSPFFADDPNHGHVIALPKLRKGGVYGIGVPFLWIGWEQDWCVISYSQDSAVNQLGLRIFWIVVWAERFRPGEWWWRKSWSG